MSQSNRIAFIDWVRGLAASLVLFQHTLELMSPSFRKWTVHYINFGMVGVCAFFLVSGYIIAHSARDKSRLHFILNRLFRIYPLFLVLLFLGVVTHFIMARPIGVKALLGNGLFLAQYLHISEYVNGSWTLFLEAIFYLLFACWRFSSFRENFWILPGISFLSLVGLVLLSNHIEHRVYSLFVLTAFFSALWYLSLQNSNLLKFVILQGSLVLFGLSWHLFVIPDPYFFKQCVGTSWCLGFVFFFSLSQIKTLGFLEKLLKWLGERSYSIYLIQGLVFKWAEYLKLPHPFWVLIIPGVYLLSHFSYLWIEKRGVFIGKMLLPPLTRKDG